MATIAPYKALYYNPKMVSDVSKVMCPPYDVIRPGEEKNFLDRSPYNFAHVILPNKEATGYKAASDRLNGWREKGILAETPTPHFYLYQQTFSINGKTYRRNTLMCAVLLSEFSDRVILPHENTHGKYKADRLQILRDTQCNLSHVFGMVRDERGELQKIFEEVGYDTPMLSGTLDEVKETLWMIPPKWNTAFETFFQSRSIYIVDGHHRYSSAVMFAKEQGTLGRPEAPSAYMLFCIANAYDPSLTVFPTHRCVRGGSSTLSREKVESVFSLTEIDEGLLTKFMQDSSRDSRFALFAWEKFFMVAPKVEGDTGKTAAERLAVTWSDEKFLNQLCGIRDEERSQKILYERNLSVALQWRTAKDLIVFHAPPAVESVLAVADESGYMPQKSTYFYPKLAAGVTMRRL